MNITEKLIAAFCDKYTKEVDIPRQLAHDLANVERIKNEIRKLEDERKKRIIEFKKCINAIDYACKEVQRSCPHPLITRHSDPSGGSDSFVSCDICGTELLAVKKV